MLSCSASNGQCKQVKIYGNFLVGIRFLRGCPKFYNFFLVCWQLTQIENEIGWVDLFTPPLFSSDSQSTLFIDSWDIGHNNGGYRHLTYHNIAKNKTFPLTRGKFTVVEILAWDDHEKVV